MQTLGYRLVCVLCLAAFAPQAAGTVVCIGADGHVAYEVPHHDDGGCAGQRDSHAPSEGSAGPSVGSLPPSCSDLVLPDVHSMGDRVVPAGLASGLAGRLPAVTPPAPPGRCFAEVVDESLAFGHMTTLLTVVLLI
jgi:hypothetical protein